MIGFKTQIFFSLLFFVYYKSLHTLLLEEFVEKHPFGLQGKTLGLFLGTFNPIHVGHEILVLNCLLYCDYVLVYALCGGDNYKPDKLPLIQRQAMLELVFLNHPQVLVTRLSPGKLQKIIMKPSCLNNQLLEPALGLSKIIGVVGSDTALALSIPESNSDKELKRVEHLAIFMRGLSIPEAFFEHSLGCVMALGAEAFIVGLRSVDKNRFEMLRSEKHFYLADRRIEAVIPIDEHLALPYPVSSSLIRALLLQQEVQHELLQACLHPAVKDFIVEQGLYFSKSNL